MICMLIVLTGCWDTINLEERGFIIGTGIDLVDKNRDNEQEPTFAVTSQMVNPLGVGGTEKGGTEPSFLNITSIGSSIYLMNADFAAKSSKVPYYEHMELILVSEDVARTEKLFSHLLDTYIRNFKMRRSIKVVITNDRPKEILDFSTSEMRLPSRMIEEMIETGGKYSGFLKPAVLGDIEEYHLTENSYLLPLLELEEQLQIKKGAIFHGQKNKMVGIFEKEELQGLALMESNTAGNIIDFVYKDEMFAFEILGIKNKLKVDAANKDDIKAKITIKLKGAIKESFTKEDFDDPKEIKSVQNAVSQKVKDLVKGAIDKSQKEFNADILHVWKKMESRHYNIWKEIKKDWEQGENYFSNVDFDIKVDTDIYSIGSTNKTD